MSQDSFSSSLSFISDEGQPVPPNSYSSLHFMRSSFSHALVAADDSLISTGSAYSLTDIPSLCGSLLESEDSFLSCMSQPGQHHQIQNDTLVQSSNSILPTRANEASDISSASHIFSAENCRSICAESGSANVSVKSDQESSSSNMFQKLLSKSSSVCAESGSANTSISSHQSTSCDSVYAKLGSASTTFSEEPSETLCEQVTLPFEDSFYAPAEAGYCTLSHVLNNETNLKHKEMAAQLYQHFSLSCKGNSSNCSQSSVHTNSTIVNCSGFNSNTAIQTSEKGGEEPGSKLTNIFECNHNDQNVNFVHGKTRNIRKDCLRRTHDARTSGFLTAVSQVRAVRCKITALPTPHHFSGQNTPSEAARYGNNPRKSYTSINIDDFLGCKTEGSMDNTQPQCRVSACHSDVTKSYVSRLKTRRQKERRFCKRLSHVKKCILRLGCGQQASGKTLVHQLPEGYC